MRVATKSVVWLLGLLALFAVAYVLLVYPEPLALRTGGGPWRLAACYRVGGRVSAVLFAPAHAVDLRLRFDEWHFDRSGPMTDVAPGEVFGD